MIDIATKEDVVDHHRRLEKLLSRPQAQGRLLAAGTVSGNPVTNAPYLSLQKPPAGSLWIVQWVRTQQNDPGTAAANVNMVGYLGSGALGKQVPVSAGGTGGEDANAFTAPLAVPSLTGMPDKIVVYPTQELYFLVIGTAGNIGAGVNYKVTVGVLQVVNSPEALTWI